MEPISPARARNAQTLRVPTRSNATSNKSTSCKRALPPLHRRAAAPRPPSSNCQPALPPPRPSRHPPLPHLHPSLLQHPLLLRHLLRAHLHQPHRRPHHHLHLRLGRRPRPQQRPPCPHRRRRRLHLHLPAAQLLPPALRPQRQPARLRRLLHARHRLRLRARSNNVPVPQLHGAPRHHPRPRPKNLSSVDWRKTR